MTNASEPITRVVFRVFTGRNGGDLIALFPDLKGWGRGECDSYQHIGQHGAADYNSVILGSRPATEAEYAPLKAELEAAPYRYRLQVRRRR